MDTAEQLLITTCASWNIALSEAQREQFKAYAELLRTWNEKVNLTAITNPIEIYRRHFLDSLSLALYWEKLPGNLLDIGSGAGFPGLPLKILFPSIKLTLAESVGKKTDFLQAAVRELGLDGVRVRTIRAEDLGRERAEREQYDLVTARAVAELRILVEYALPLVRVGGRMLAPKGASAYDETSNADKAIELLGGELRGIELVQIPGLESRAVVVIDKLRATDARYPRAPGIPGRKPL